MKQQTALNKLIDFLNEEICERRDYSASKMCEVIRLKIETELLEEEKERIEKAVVYGNRQEFYDGTEEIGNNYFNSTYTQSSE